MISDHAHHQNLQKRKELEGLGYRFSIGHDGWDVFFDDEAIAQGPPAPGKGEQKTRGCLDAAVHQACKVHNARAVVTKVETPKPEPKPITPIAKKQVAAAINLLVAAGAQYRIALGDDVLTNMPDEPKKEKRTNYRDFYQPLLAPYKGQGPFTVDLEIPETLDFDACVSTIIAHIRNTYGNGNYTTETNRATRTLTVLVANAPFTEE